MEELQGWWEVPTIAHFCHVYQSTFKLFHFEIEELESALLQNNTYPDCATIEQLIIQLLKGCYARKGVNSENWEELLYKLLRKEEEVSSRKKRKNSLADIDEPFDELPVRKKVEILLKLCELRLDSDDVCEAIKNLNSDHLRVEPVGTDSDKNVYYYFFGLRLYKEDPDKAVEIKKQKNAVQNVKPASTHIKTRTSQRFNGAKTKNLRSSEKPPEVEPIVSSAWSVVCRTFEDWENLIQSFKKSKKDKDLGNLLEKKYFPVISNVAAMRDRLERKKLIDLAPRRMSSRIEKVKQIQEEREKIAMLREAEKQKKRQAIDDEQRKQDEIVERGRRLAERWAAINERSQRAALREQKLRRRQLSGSKYNIRSRSPVSFQNGCSDESDSDDDDDDEDSDVSQNHDDEDNMNGSENEQSESESEGSGDESGESASGQSSSAEKEICDTNSGFHNKVYPSQRNHVQLQNVNLHSFVTRNFPQMNSSQLGSTLHRGIRTYSKLDQFYNERSEASAVSRTIRVDFIKAPPNSIVIPPVQFYPSSR